MSLSPITDLGPLLFALTLGVWVESPTIDSRMKIEYLLGGGWLNGYGNKYKVLVECLVHRYGF